jgi:2'-5' RNA ligase
LNVKVQARIVLPPELGQEIDRVRIAWNPERATGNPAHITVAYHDEAPDASLLIERVRQAASQVPRFRLVVGAVTRFLPPVCGAFLTVADPTGQVDAVRNAILSPPFCQRKRFGLHVTLLHPDQGERLEAAWPSLLELPTSGEFEVAEIEVVGPDNAPLAVFPLAVDASAVTARHSAR